VLGPRQRRRTERRGERRADPRTRPDLGRARGHRDQRGVAVDGVASSDYSLDGAGAVPAGATVTFYAFYAPPAAGVATVDLKLGGFGETVPTPVPR
jgi:hypothetical protein